MQKRLFGIAAMAATTAVLVVPSGAGATKAGDKTFAQTFPVASRLCTDVAAGKRPRLKAVAETILADCTTLETNFSTVKSSILATRASTATQIAADKALINAACPAPATEKPKPACVNARKTQTKAIGALRKALTAAARNYYKTVESDRRSFWHSIKLLRPLAHIHADKPIQTPKNP
jgi:hypothetical protein